VFFEAFFQLQFGFVIFCRKNIGAKAACKALVNLTTDLPVIITTEQLMQLPQGENFKNIFLILRLLFCFSIVTLFLVIRLQ